MATPERAAITQSTSWTTTFDTWHVPDQLGPVRTGAEKVFDGTELTLSKGSVVPVILGRSADSAYVLRVSRKQNARNE